MIQSIDFGWLAEEICDTAKATLERSENRNRKAQLHQIIIIRRRRICSVF